MPVKVGLKFIEIWGESMSEGLKTSSDWSEGLMDAIIYKSTHYTLD